MSASDEYLFWSKADRSGDCWEWTDSRNTYGYGVVRRGKKLLKAHRVAFEYDNGPIPAGLEVDHACHNKACVKPAHLRAATHKQNQENRVGAQGNNVNSGVRGVYPVGKRWKTLVTHNGKKYTAGIFDTVEEAEPAITALRNELFTHNIRDRRNAA